MHSKLLNSYSVHPPLSDGKGVEPPTKFSKKGLLHDRTSTFRVGFAGKERGDFIQGVQFSYKNKSKSEIMAKKVYEQKYFSLS